jgi:hypothetical protein
LEALKSEFLREKFNCLLHFFKSSLIRYRLLTGLWMVSLLGQMSLPVP